MHELLTRSSRTHGRQLHGDRYVDEAIPEVNHARSGVEHLNRSATVQSTEILGTTLSATW